MKTIFLITIFIAFTSNIFSANNYTLDTLKKNEIDSILAIKEFVFNASYITTKEGVKYNCGSFKNFISIHNSIATIQLEEYGGENWIVYEDTLDKFVLNSFVKKKACYNECSFSLTNGENYVDVNLWVDCSGEAYCVLTGSNSSSIFTYHGEIKPFSKELFYKKKELFKNIK